MQTVCHFEGREIALVYRQRLTTIGMEFLVRFLVPPLDLFFEFLSKFMIEKGSKSKLFVPLSL